MKIAFQEIKFVMALTIALTYLMKIYVKVTERENKWRRTV
jgi:hypothetical protein